MITLSLTCIIAIALFLSLDIIDDIMRLQAERYRCSADDIEPTPADWTDLHINATYTATYTAVTIERSLDAQLCSILAVVYPRITRFVESSAIWYRTAAYNIRMQAASYLLTGDRHMTLKGIIRDRVQETLARKIDALVDCEVNRQLQDIDLDSVITDRLGDSTPEETPAQPAADTKEDHENVPERDHEVDAKGNLLAFTTHNGVQVDCTEHRFDARPHEHTGASITMVQGTTNKPGIVIGEYNQDKYLCLTSQGGVVVRRKDSVTLKSSKPSPKKTTALTPIKVATAGDYTIAAPDYKGSSPVAFVADGSLVKRNGTVLTVKASSPKGAMWIENPHTLPSSLINGASTVVPVVYTSN